MNTYLSCENIPSCPRSVALGLFDGLHPAHRQVILSAAADMEDGTHLSVYTFDPATITTKPILRLSDEAEMTYNIVGSQEANVMEKKISEDSPFGKALMGAKEGDTVTVEAPRGSIRYRVEKIER